MSVAKKRLICQEVVGWPKLAWATVTRLGSSAVSVFHGSFVETNRDWCVEAVWAGDFSEGNFDLTDIVAGTGVRLRDEKIIFVSSGDTLNRLHYFREDDTIYVSNSLPALMAIADLSLLCDYDYHVAMESIINGLERFVRKIPSTRGPICITYFNNIVVTNTGVSESSKPCAALNFADFATYRDYLFSSARIVGENARASERRHLISSLASLSRGYDSPAAAVLAREAGTRDAVTIAHARRAPGSIFDNDDSGAIIARQLGMTCKIYFRDKSNYAYEEAVWASVGNVGDLNLTIFDYPQPLCLLFTGFYGDVLWDPQTSQPDFLRRTDSSGARFSECRLELGVFNCSPVYWGCRNEQQIKRLGNAQEMLQWKLGTEYDRPIPRRLVEEAGVSRDAFGIQKRASSFNRRFGRPISIDLREDFAAFLKCHGSRPASGVMETVSLGFRAFDSLFLKKLPEFVRFSCREWVKLPPPSMFFIWANQRRKRRYLAAFQKVCAGKVHNSRAWCQEVAARQPFLPDCASSPVGR